MEGRVRGMYIVNYIVNINDWIYLSHSLPILNIVMGQSPPSVARKKNVPLALHFFLFGIPCIEPGVHTYIQYRNRYDM